MAVPGDPSSTMSAEEHNVLDLSAYSPFTSWTASLELARRFASPGGVVLKVATGSPGPGELWSWEYSPDSYLEQEVLLRGFRMGIEVLP